MDSTEGGGAPKDAGWRALELRRRVENRRQAAAGGARVGVGVGAAPVKQAPLSAFNNGTLMLPVSPANSPYGSSGSNAVSLPRLVQANRESHDIRMQILDAETRHYATLASCDRQFSTENAVRLLASDISVVQQNVRQKHVQLEDLHRRVLRLSKSLHDASPDKAFVSTKLRLEEDIRHQHLEGQCCPSCGKLLLSEAMSQHANMCIGGATTISLPRLPAPSNQSSHCSRIASPSTASRLPAVSLPSIQSEPILPRFVSQPPRNLRVVEDGVDHRSILLAWEPPIFTGSKPIIDYELRFSSRRTGGKSSDRQKSVEPLPPLLTSRWCLQVPVAPNQFRVDGLEGAQEYCEFLLCAITANGKSEFSNPVDLVTTAPSIEPTRVLFPCSEAVTATTITLSWIEPLDSGGKPIVDYEITFIEAIMEDKDATRFEDRFLNVAEVTYRPRRIRTYSASTTFTIMDLLSGKEHKQFRVRAVNDDGKPGEYSEPIESIFTIAPGNEFRLLDELQAAVNSRARIIDSLFLSGFMQRYDRQHYIQLVSRFVTTTHPELEAKVNAIVSGDAAEPQVEENDVQVQEEQPAKLIRKFDDLTDDEKIAERRRQFHFRLAELRDELKRAEYNVHWCKDRRIDLVALIRPAEARILEKQAELERARMFRGPQMDSDVFENGRQRFYTKELVIALEDEIEIDQLYIVDTKSEMIRVENSFRADEKRRDTLAKRLEERLNALADFERNPIATREENAAAATLVKLQHGRVLRAFMALAKNRIDNKEMREKMKATLLRFKHYHLRASLRKWLAAVNMDEGRSSSSVNELIGIGSRELLGAAMDRDDLLVEAQEVLKQIRTVDDHLGSIKWTKDQARRRNDGESDEHRANSFMRDGRPISHLEFEKYSSVLLEADMRMRLRDYADALRLYQSAYDNTKWMEWMSPQQVVALVINIGKAIFELQQYEQAAAHFRRASLLSTRSSLRHEHAEAELRLGGAYFELRSLRSSIESYERSLLAFGTIGDKQGELSCYRGLQRTYSKLGDKEMEETNRQLANEIEFALANTLESANKQLDRLQQRIVGAGANSSCEIALERVGAIVPRLRRERITRKLVIREELRFAESLEKLLVEKKKLLAQGEEDLKRALASDSSEVDSSVINGCSARYEIENFKKKLAKLMGGVRAGEENIAREIANAKIRVSNAEDEIHELEQELIVETGALMQRMMGKERLRCFRFNATNEHLKSVVGTASGGFSTCVAAAGMSGLLFDVLTGACLAQAIGDPRKEHLGAPTGHQAPIVSLFYTERRVYTGCADATLGVWDVLDELIGGYSISLTKMLYEFDAAVVSVAADTDWFACGCSDCDVFVFDAHTLAIVVRLISTHSQTVTALCVASPRGVLTTGGADHRVKVWRLEAPPSSASSTRRRATLAFTLEASKPQQQSSDGIRTRGHLHSITCVKQAANEIVSGDAVGRVIVWNLDADDKLLRMCDPHRGDAVTCLQFDATRIVSGSSRGAVCVIDFATGNLLQTLHGHHEAVMDLQFDRKRLVSMSSDGKLRLWYWVAAGTGDGKTKKFHIVGAGETLRSLSLKYRTNTHKLLQWNGLPDSTHVYLGQKLIVGVMDADGSTGAWEEEMKTLDRATSVAFGKLSYENLDFVAANQAKTTDAESQWAAQKVAMLAKEYFPPLDDDEKAQDDNAGDDKSAKESEDESDGSDLDIPVGVDGGGDGDDEGDGEQSDGASEESDDGNDKGE